MISKLDRASALAAEVRNKKLPNKALSWSSVRDLRLLVGAASSV
jgi:hypothetical protein